VKVWIYKGDILPYQLTNDEKIVREAAMAAGDAVPVGATPSVPKGVVRAGGGRRRVEPDATEEIVLDVNPADLIAANDEVERQLSVEEEIERRTAQDHTDTPHFRKDAE
jgi:small subunit ribosomal protein S3